jgi:pimeloyl-ACP methyl ester carboxylesterase
MRASLALTLLILLGLAAAGCAAAPDDPVGLWMGTLDAGGAKLRLAFHVSRNPDGSIHATADSLDQGASGLQVDGFGIADGTLRIEMKMIGGSFEGKLSADGKRAEGKWSQSGASLPLTLERVDKLPEIRRPQAPVKPYPYAEEEVSYENAAAGVKLAATLTYPKSGGPFPAVVLITGSGAQDRNESLLGHQPFLVLADYLTRRGIAVLRADDRGVGGSTGDPNKATTEDYAGDALAGVAYLKTRIEIDPKRIGLVGHSEGGMIAPMAAARSSDVAFIVMIAGSGVDGEHIVLEQQDLIAKALGATDEAVAAQHAQTEEIIAIVKEGKDSATAEKLIRDTLTARYAPMTEEQRKASGVTDEAIETQIQATVGEMLSPWFRFFLAYDPAPTLAKVRVPVLAVWGSKDLQVPPAQNLPVVEAALKAGGNAHHTVKELPGLNHLLQTATTGSPTEYAQIEETMSPAALQLIAGWILDTVKAM